MSRNEYMRTVGNSIRRNRIALKLSQAALAEASGASEASISRWELGKGMISGYAKDRLREFFKVKWAERAAVEATAKGVSFDV